MVVVPACKPISGPAQQWALCMTVITWPTFGKHKNSSLLTNFDRKSWKSILKLGNLRIFSRISQSSDCNGPRKLKAFVWSRIACEKALCLGKGLQNHEVREGNGSLSSPRNIFTLSPDREPVHKLDREKQFLPPNHACMGFIYIQKANWC